MPILNVHFINPYCKFIPDTYNNHENILTLKLWLRLVCFYLTTMKNTCNINFRHVKTIFCKAFNKILQLLLKYGHYVFAKKCYTRNLSIPGLQQSVDITEPGEHYGPSGSHSQRTHRHSKVTGHKHGHTPHPGADPACCPVSLLHLRVNIGWIPDRGCSVNDPGQINVWWSHY